MCGIAGYVSISGQTSAPSLLRSMCDQISHRGPDDFGEWRDSACALGHRRLSIIDLSGGHQPLGNEDGSLQIVFNGEIYNYLNLRKDLLRNGHRFRTNSDTEVLVHLYEEVGERLPEYLNGMFAIAIWDSTKQQLFLARDRFGEKPLYYSESLPGMDIAFASELKALRVVPGFCQPVDSRSVADFLTFSYVLDPDSIYKGIHKVAPGSSLLWKSDGATRTRRYWSLSFEPNEDTSFQNTIEEIRTLSIDSVTSRLMSEVPLGAFLSGGVDSSIVVAIMAKHAGLRVQSFSIGFEDREFDELEYARLVADRFKIQHFEEVLTPSIHEILDSLVNHFDEPFGDSSAIPMLYLARMTRKHVTVALSGDGADEIFGGYRRYCAGTAVDGMRNRIPKWVRNSLIQPAAKVWPRFASFPRPFRIKSALKALAQDLADNYFDRMTAMGDRDLLAILSPDLKEDLGGYLPRQRFRGFFEGLGHLSPLEQMQAVDCKTYLPGDILCKVDRCTMAYSLEARAPFLDYRLAEAAAKLPSRFKLTPKTGKAIFKRAFENYLPPKTLLRGKMGFGVPLASWFRSSLRPTFESLVFAPEMEAYLSLGRIRSIWHEHQNGISGHSSTLWNCLMLACWQRRHNSRGSGGFN